MAVRILLDAGHFGKQNRYHVLKPIEYYESEMTWKLHLCLKEALEAYGFEVGTTREKQEADLPVSERGKMAKYYDLAVSLHSNTSENAKTERAVVIVYQNDLAWTDIDEKSAEMGVVLGETVKETMGLSSYQIYRKKHGADRDRNGMRDDEWYGFLYGARLSGTPAVIVEHGFHTHKPTAEWLYNDDNLKKLAEAEAAALAEYYGLTKRGDVNGDGVVDSLDAVEVLKYDAGLTELGEAQKVAADFNKDGEVDTLDAADILKHDAGL